MKFEISKKEIVGELKKLNTFTRRTISAFTSAVYISAENNSIMMIVNGQTIGCKFVCQTNVMETGTVTVLCQGLMSVIELMPEGFLTFYSENNKLVIKQGSCKMALSCLDSSSFILPPDADILSSVSVPECIFKQMIGDAKRFCETRPEPNVQNQMHLTVSDNTMCLTATDCRQVIIREEESADKNNIELIFSAQDILSVERLLSDSPDKEKLLTLSVSKNLYHIKVGSYVITGRQTDMVYPNIYKLMSYDFNSYVEVDTAELLDAINRCVYISSSAMKPVVMDLGEILHLSVESATGAVDEKIICNDFQGKSIKIGMNPIFLRNVLQVYPDEKIRLYYINPVSPLSVKITGYTFFLLPTKISVS